MFTGLVEELGSIISVSKGSKSSVLTIKAAKVLEDVKIGDSISTNGVCLTVTHFTKDAFTVDVMPETIERSNLKFVRPGSIVNLERALRIGDRLGGHLVSGHIDGLGTVVSIEKDDNAVWYTLSASPTILKYIIEKGSVALDGISLTVASADFQQFKVSIIPHTHAVTTLAQRRVGDQINVECDAFGKYVERISAFSSTEQESTKKQSKIDIDFLKNNGFY
ncbi:MAG TPA: riboflavin synthase [Clostridiales bacterium UBA8960]|nr:riboflavin synthase [Clostridiales bacterium UBA8960]